MNCIVTCAFREPYVTHNLNQERVIKEFMDVEIIKFINELPYKEGVVTKDIIKRFQKSLYGFKPHAIQTAINKGYDKIIWFDPSVMPLESPQVIFDALDTHPMMVIIGDAELSAMSNQESLKWFKVKKEDIKGTKHIGGTIYAFNFNDQKTKDVFNLWKLAEESGIFGGQNEFHEGHWADESCMALSMFKNGVPQIKNPFKYKNQKDG